MQRGHLVAHVLELLGGDLDLPRADQLDQGHQPREPDVGLALFAELHRDLHRHRQLLIRPHAGGCEVEELVGQVGLAFLEGEQHDRTLQVEIGLAGYGVTDADQGHRLAQALGRTVEIAASVAGPDDRQRHAGVRDDLLRLEVVVLRLLPAAILHECIASPDEQHRDEPATPTATLGHSLAGNGKRFVELVHLPQGAGEPGHRVLVARVELEGALEHVLRLLVLALLARRGTLLQVELEELLFGGLVDLRVLHRFFVELLRFVEVALAVAPGEARVVERGRAARGCSEADHGHRSRGDQA